MSLLGKADEPIIMSLLDVDQYKGTMGQFIHNRYSDVPVRFGFTNRTKSVCLAREIDQGQFREELQHARNLRAKSEEVDFLRQQRVNGKRVFKDPYLDFFGSLALPPFELEYWRDQIRLEFPGRWDEVSHWETISLSIANELYYRAQLKKMGVSKEDAVIAEGKKRLFSKIELLWRYPEIHFMEFGTRRRFARAWQEYVVRVFIDKLPKQLLGTSNMLLAMKYGITPMGTNAHELQMILAGINSETDEELSVSQGKLLQAWWDEYGEEFSIVLPDTFGSECVFRTMTREQANGWKGFRHDSGDPIKFGERVIRFYQDLEIDPRRKLIVFSDGLDVATMIKIITHFRGRIQVTFGWGTNATNDLGFKPLSLVTKAIEAMGRKLVKLSDNIEKAIGPRDEVERYKRVFGYDCHFSETPVY